MLDMHTISGSLAALAKLSSVHVYDYLVDGVSAAKATQERGNEQKDMGRLVPSGDSSRGSPEPVETGLIC